MIKKTSLLALVTSMFLLTACPSVPSTDLKENTPYHQEYFTDYDANKQEIYAAGTIRTNSWQGAAIELKDNSSLKINGETTTFSSITTRHFKTLAGLKDINFLLTKNNGNQFTNTITSGDIDKIRIAFPSSFPTALSKSAGISFQYDGTDAQPGETISLGLYGKGNDDKGLSVAINAVGKQLNITADKLKDFKTGETISLTFRRSYKVSLQQQDQSAGGTINISYTSKKDVLIN